MKKLTTVTFLLIFSFVFTSCTSVASSSSNVSSSSSTNSTSSDSSTHISKELAANLTVDADIVIPAGIDSAKADVLVAKPKQLNQDTAFTLLFKNETIDKHTLTDEKWYVGTLPLNQYISKNGTYLNTNGISVAFSNPKYDYLHYSFRPDKTAVEYNTDKFSPSMDLPFESRAEAANKITEILKTLGITDCKNYTCYALDYKTLQAQEHVINIDGKSEVQPKAQWTAEDDCYYFEFQAEIGGLPILQESRGSFEDGTMVAKPSIQVYYNKSGIIQLNLSNLYETDSVEQKGVPLISVNNALDTVKKKFDTIIVTDPTKVNKISLQYVPVVVDSSHTAFRLVPCWCFNAAQTITQQKGTASSQPYVQDMHIYIDAVTGKEIV